MGVFKQKYFVIGAAVIYLFLTMLFIVFLEEERFTNVCVDDDVCVRFCCRNRTTCNDKFIRDNFKGNFSYYPFNETKNVEEFKLLLGAPTCTLTLVQPHESWHFIVNGEIKVNKLIFLTEMYCMQESSVSASSIEWNLFVCDTKLGLRKMIHFILVTISSLLLATGAFVYYHFKDLSTTNHGASVKRLLVGICLTNISLLLLPNEQLLFMDDDEDAIWIFGVAGVLIGLGLAFIWMSVLTFDLWWTINKNEQSSEDKERFKYYKYFAFGFFGLFFFVLFFPDTRNLRIIDAIVIICLIGLFLITAIADVVLLTLSAHKLFVMAKNMNISDYNWFGQQRNKFWTCLQVYAIMMITWSMEIYSLTVFISNEAILVVDFVEFFSALLLFAIFVLNKEVRSMIVTRYSTLRH